MIHKCVVPANRVNEVKSWLTENLGQENYRWWATKCGTPEWVGVGTKIGYHWDMEFYIEPTEEEEPMLTLFLLRWL